MVHVDPATATMLEEARRLAGFGWPVLPLFSIRNGACDCPDTWKADGRCKPGKHPRTISGVKDATTNTDTLERWWGRQWPYAGIAISLEPAGLLDIAPDSLEWHGEFVARGLPRTASFRSGGGDGHEHYLYRRPAGCPTTKINKPGEYDLIVNGYCVVPPTMHQSGDSYRWLVTPEEIGELPIAPNWAVDMLRTVTARTSSRAAGARPMDDGEPPVLFGADALKRWRGEAFRAKPDGTPDRSGALYDIGRDLAEAGVVSADLIADCLRERDESLGWNKYAGRGDADVRYAELAELVVRRAGEDRNRARVGTPPSTPAPPPSAPAEPGWPQPLASEALYGLAGAIVRAIDPYTEADCAAVLAHILPILGVYIGPSVHALAGDATHPARLNSGIVGVSSKARKGSSSQPVLRVVRLAEGMFASTRILQGLSSGEGLIWQCRDPIYKRERVKQSGGVFDYQDVEADPGISDKRLVVLEPEFANVLRVMQRDGNTLSAVVRLAWDTGNLRTLTKNSPAVATGAHVSVIGHITKDELLRYLDRSELASGFANRFLWIAARRARLLPDGEATPDDVLAPFARQLAQVFEWARQDRRLRRDTRAAAIWHEIYPTLSEGAPGLFGAATSRAEALVLRLSVLYAALDCSPSITAHHLLAALAVWRYAEDSARWIFGDATGDPSADTILAALRHAGELTRNDIVDLFGRHANRARIDRALGVLLQHGVVEVRRESGTGGRPREVWRAR